MNFQIRLTYFKYFKWTCCNLWKMTKSMKNNLTFMEKYKIDRNQYQQESYNSRVELLLIYFKWNHASLMLLMRQHVTNHIIIWTQVNPIYIESLLLVLIMFIMKFYIRQTKDMKLTPYNDTLYNRYYVFLNFVAILVYVWGWTLSMVTY